MPPKYKVTKEEIIEAAYKVLSEQGESFVTTRAIAEQLGVSSRPIYSFFPSMETLIQALIEKCSKIMEEYMRKEITPDAFLNMGIGYVVFWKENPHVFDFMHQSTMGFQAAEEQMIGEYLDKMKQVPLFEGLSDDDLLKIYENMSIYTYGLVQYLRISKDDFSLSELISMLEDAGEAQFVHKIWKKNNGKNGNTNHFRSVPE